MKKRLISMLLVVTMVASMAGCASTGKETRKRPKKQVEVESSEDFFADEDTKKSKKHEEKTEVATTEEIKGEATTEEVVSTEEVTSTEEVITTEEVATTQEVVTDEATPKTSTAVKIDNLSDDLYSFQASIDGVIYQFPMWYEDFAALGWHVGNSKNYTNKLKANTYTVESAKREDKFTATIRIANISANACNFDKCIVAGIDIDEYSYSKYPNMEFIIPGGFKIGVATLDEVVAKYGTPSNEYESEYSIKYTYELDYHQKYEVVFNPTTKILNGFEIQNIVELEGADNSVNTDIPDDIKAYKAPSKITDSLFDYTFELEGKKYMLPCPASEFVNNGFKFKTRPEAVIAGGYDRGEFSFNNQTSRIYLYNTADYATLPENCWIRAIEASTNGPKWNIKVAGGITIGSTEEELLAVIDNDTYEYEKNESSSYTEYRVYGEDSRKTVGYEFYVKDGKVYKIKIEFDGKIKNW